MKYNVAVSSSTPLNENLINRKKKTEQTACTNESSVYLISFFCSSRVLWGSRSLLCSMSRKFVILRSTSLYTDNIDSSIQKPFIFIRIIYYSLEDTSAKINSAIWAVHFPEIPTYNAVFLFLYLLFQLYCLIMNILLGIKWDISAMSDSLDVY